MANLLLFAPASSSAPGEAEPTPYRVYVVNTHGERQATLDNANIDYVEDELNGPGAASLHLSTTDPGALDVTPLVSEIQIWRNGSILWWGVVTRMDADSERVTFQCRGLLWYFEKRFFGKADRTNLLSNPEAESDTTGWTAVTATASGSTTRKQTGSKSFKLVQAAAGVDAYLHQTVTVTGTAIGTLLTLAGWFFVEMDGYLGPAYAGRGLFVQATEGGTLRDVQFARITDDTPRRVWQRAEVEIWVPPRKTYSIQVRLYAPGGTTYWDAISLTAMESLSTATDESTLATPWVMDQAKIARRIVDYAQDNEIFTHGKSSLRIQATIASTPDTGVTRERHYQFAEHANIGFALREFTELDDGLDYSVEYTATKRTFTTYFPAKGTDLTGSVTIANTDLSGLSYSFDGEQAVSSVVVLGEGDGPDREEGSAIDNTLFGGKTFEMVVPAPVGMPIDALDAYAEEMLDANSNPTSIKVSVPNSQVEVTGVVQVGDLIDLDIDHGCIVASGDHKVVAWSLDPSNDVVTLELVPA